MSQILLVCDLLIDVASKVRKKSEFLMFAIQITIDFIIEDVSPCEQEVSSQVHNYYSYEKYIISVGFRNDINVLLLCYNDNIDGTSIS